MKGRTTLLLVALALVAVAALPAATGAELRAVGPQPKQMALTPRDVGHVSYVKAEGFTVDGPIAATRGYRRTFAGLTPLSVQLLTVEDTVLIGKTPDAAAAWIASFERTSKSQAGLDRLQAQWAKAYETYADLKITKGTLVRARSLPAGDGAAEVVFRFACDDRSVVQVGQLFVRVGGNLSAISFNGAMPGLTGEVTRQLALAAASRMREAGATA